MARMSRKSVNLIAGMFLAMKTPLDSRYESRIHAANIFTPDMVLKSMEGYKCEIGLWIDLTNTSRFYDKKQIPCSYVKLACGGHKEPPTEDQVNAFISIISKFKEQNPLKAIIVHCTHGFNRTGFMIGAYLVEHESWSPEASIQAFAQSRPPGIYKQDYLTEFFRRYGDIEDAPNAPTLPDWCFEDDEKSADEDGNSVEPSSSSNSQKQAKAGKFMEGISGVEPVTDVSLLANLRRKVQKMCQFKSNGFPGCQPVSMDLDNLKFVDANYMVSWKADGTRYMMLIDGPNNVYCIDRDNCYYKVANITFLEDNMQKDLEDTLVDGEMVIDEDFRTKQKFPRYLIYDIVQISGHSLMERDFQKRMAYINSKIIMPRRKAREEGRINAEMETFGPKFTKEKSRSRTQTASYFNPSKLHINVEEILAVVKESREGYIPSLLGLLFVGGHKSAFDQIRVVKGLSKYNNKIIECKWDGEWKFMRERTDKSFPNAYSTAQGVLKSITHPVTEEILCKHIYERKHFNRH
ncbi:RNGTT [Lepeophtheirus salmonis]|uniref:mRNA-capping enzyme n=1 Tax=Lepeophtheirus salmonis TaxID=72036 RepID=A0A7R8H8S9_LEPSM|nr:RNGTT [Lepeophtheirus salmonis]CAF2943763.1 RNGTT [Lepeophtheirus salmonis]